MYIYIYIYIYTCTTLHSARESRSLLIKSVIVRATHKRILVCKIRPPVTVTVTATVTVTVTEQLYCSRPDGCENSESDTFITRTS